jgi:hypothetical protein
MQSECKTPRSQPCGGRFALHDHTTDEVIRARWLCTRLHCPDCGPRRRAGYVDKYLPLFDGGPVVVSTIAKDAWPKRRRKLVDAGVIGVPFPGPGDTRTIVATGGPGEAWADPREALEAAVAAIPTTAIDGSRIRLRPRPFGIPKPKPKASSGKPAGEQKAKGGAAPPPPDQQKRYEVLGFPELPDFAIDALADQLGITHKPALLGTEWADGHRYHVPLSSPLGQQFLAKWRIRPPQAVDPEGKKIETNRRRMHDKHRTWRPPATAIPPPPPIQGQLPGVAA